MYKQKCGVLVLVFLFCVFSKAFGQILVNPATGCLPTGVTNALFTYTGPGSPTNVLWDFGDGSPTSTQLPTQHSYPSLGSYTVKFTAVVGGSPVTYTFLVTVSNPPTGSIASAVPATHCAPMTVTFTGTGTGNNLVYTWAFGDLGGASGPSVTHAYLNAGAYTPNVTIQNTLTGCFVTYTGTPVNVSNPPFISVNATPGTFTCAPSFTTSFDASGSVSGSPLGGGLSYNWNFGPFGTSTQANTGNIVFSPVGVYVVTVTATDNNKCSADKTILVSLLSPTVTAVVPKTVCIQPQMPQSPQVFQVTVNSNQPSTKWEMGDGTTITFPIPIPPFPAPILTPNTPYSGTIHAYTTPGLKTLTITVQSGLCIATINPTIFVEEITPSFTSVPPSLTCDPTFTIGLVNQTTVNSGSTLNYAWEVNHQNDLYPSSTIQFTTPGYKDTQTNPTFTLSQGSLSPYVNHYHKPYYITPRLVVTSQPNGCIAKFAATTDTIHRPTALFEVLDEAEGCVPLTVTFTNTSNVTITGTNIAFPIVSYTWNFGASPSSTLAGFGAPTQTPIPFTGYQPIPQATYTYTSPGVYYVTLSITTANGCMHTSYQHTINVVNPPTINYILPTPAEVCLGQPFTVTLSAAPTETVQHWHLEGDNGFYSGCVSNNKPTWQFSHYGTGTQVFTISAYQHGCKSTVVTPPIQLKGPLGKLSYETSCTNRKDVKVHYHLEAAHSAIIEFGDGQTQVVSGNPAGVASGFFMHTYNFTTPSAIFIATITSKNTLSGCPLHTFTIQIELVDLVADFEFPEPVVCKNSFIAINASLSVNVFTTLSTGYTWFIDDQPPLQRFTHTVIAGEAVNHIVGVHSVTLMVKDLNGCVATKVKTYRVSSPATDFKFSSNPICFSSQPVQMIDLTPQTPEPVIDYAWGMGDHTLNNQPPGAQSVIQAFNTPGHSPFFTYPNIKGLQTYTFAVVLTNTNSLGCVNSNTHVLTVNDPRINILVDRPFGCAPEAKTFSYVAAHTHVTYTVDYGEGAPLIFTGFNTNSVYPHVYSYNNPGNFVATFTLVDNAGCTAKQSMPMVIEAKPVAQFTFENVITKVPGPGDFCAPFSPSVTSLTQSPHFLLYTWDLGTLSGAQTTTASTATDNYPDGEGTYTISLLVKTALAGCASYTQNIVNVFSPKINFRLDPDSLKTMYCLGEPITLTITSHSGVREGYQFDFGDGIVTQSIFPINTIPSTLKSVYTNTYYPVATNGEVNIQLVAYAGKEPSVCKDVKYKKVKIERVLADFNRNAEIAKLDSMHCVGVSELFKNLSAVNIPDSPLSYTWTLGDGSAQQTGLDAAHSYTAPGTYSVTLKAIEPANGCMDSVIKKMVIFPSPTGTVSIVPFSCPMTPFIMNGSGTPGVSGLLTGTMIPGPIPLNFDATNSFSVSVTASTSTTYTLKVRDENGCENSAATASIYIVPSAPHITWDTTVVIGEHTPLNAYVGTGFTYTWSPLVDYLNCDTCLIHNPVSSSTVNITYTVMVEDEKKCSIVENTYHVNIELKASLDVPSAFTPNGDGINDVIFPDGWGLKTLRYFRVFNRWGQLVFESNDLNVGWNGVFQGVPQNMETYVYQVSADTYSEREPVITKTGTFKLLR